MLQRVIFVCSKYLAVPYNYSADNSAICSAGNHVGQSYSRREYPRLRKNVPREDSTGHATEREGVAIARLCVAAPQRFPIIGNVGENAQCTWRLPTSHVAHLPLPCVPACFDRFFFLWHVCAGIVVRELTRRRFCFSRAFAKIVIREQSQRYFCHFAVVKIENLKCRKCLVSVVNAIKRECLFTLSRDVSYFAADSARFY